MPKQKIVEWVVPLSPGGKMVTMPTDADTFAVRKTNSGVDAALSSTVNVDEYGVVTGPVEQRTFWFGRPGEILPSEQYPAKEWEKRYLGSVPVVEVFGAYHVWELRRK